MGGDGPVIEEINGFLRLDNDEDTKTTGVSATNSTSSPSIVSPSNATKLYTI